MPPQHVMSSHGLAALDDSTSAARKRSRKSDKGGKGNNTRTMRGAALAQRQWKDMERMVERLVKQDSYSYFEENQDLRIDLRAIKGTTAPPPPLPSPQRRPRHDRPRPRLMTSVCVASEVETGSNTRAQNRGWGGRRVD